MTGASSRPMRVLGIGESVELGSMYLDLRRSGHDVRVAVSDGECRGNFAGLLTTVPRWEDELAWIRDAGTDGFIVFETSSQGALQEDLRKNGFQVIGGSAFGDRLESDRAFGQQIMREVGMKVAPTHGFVAFEEAIAWVRAHPRRYVYKPSGSGFASGRTFVSGTKDGADLLAYLALQRLHWPAEAPVRFVLMERVQGVEVGVGAYFDGTRFLSPACLDWEHKRFFPGDLGELTGEMGTLVTYRRSGPLFRETLGRMEAVLRDGRYRGYININTIVDADGVHPLEFTCRFGYPGFAILQPLQTCGWDVLFRRMQDGADLGPFETGEGFSVGVVMTVPPFPYSHGYDRLSKGLPIFFAASLSEDDHRHLHFCEVAFRDGQLVTSGTVGYIMVVTGAGLTAAEARTAAYDRAAKVLLPNGRYRPDIAARFIDTDEALLRSWGWL